jgi:hypothetical protein
VDDGLGGCGLGGIPGVEHCHADDIGAGGQGERAAMIRHRDIDGTGGQIAHYALVDAADHAADASVSWGDLDLKREPRVRCWLSGGDSNSSVGGIPAGKTCHSSPIRASATWISVSMPSSSRRTTSSGLE